MYSTSNSYLGAGNSARPGPPQYGQSYSQQGQQQQNATQQLPYNAPQPTGFGAGQIQPQYTGYPASGQQQNFQASQQQPQFSGYPQQNQQLSQNQLPQQQSFQTGQVSQQQAAPQKTGQTSSQIAQSFSSTPASQSLAPQATASSTKIPKIRLSFLTATDQAKFEQLFKSAVGDQQALDGKCPRKRSPATTKKTIGEKVKDLLIRSKLPGADLMKIWYDFCGILIFGD